MRDLSEYSLYTLAEPYMESLPEQVSLSTAVIAETPPRVLRRAVAWADPDHVRAMYDARQEVSSYSQTTIDRMRQNLDDERDALSNLQERVSDEVQRGEVPSAEDLRLLYQALPADQCELADELAQDEPKADEAMLKAEAAEMAQAYLEAQTKLRGEVQKDLNRLSFTGRMSLIGAGALTGAGAGIYAFMEKAADDPRTFSLIFGLVTTLLTTGAGFAASKNTSLKYSLAHWNARRVVKRTGQTQE